MVAATNRRTSDRFVKPAIPPTIVSAGGASLVNPHTSTSAGSPMDITKT